MGIFGMAQVKLVNWTAVSSVHKIGEKCQRFGSPKTWTLIKLVKIPKFPRFFLARAIGFLWFSDSNFQIRQGWKLRRPLWQRACESSSVWEPDLSHEGISATKTCRNVRGRWDRVSKKGSDSISTYSSTKRDKVSDSTIKCHLQCQNICQRNVR